ncbi:MAG: SOS response-associated peptidase [Spirochaetes bacterium]|nr:SOS response-associated peptidase [Spirochaetota bacterium]
MCGRFAFYAEKKQLEEFFPHVEWEFWPGKRYNICPGQDLLAIVFSNRYVGKAFRWGLIPSWAKDPAIGNKLINARSETIATKPSFRKPLLSQRCVIPASGFYEWKREGNRKIPHFIRYASGKPMLFAGLYDSWKKDDGSFIDTVTIITRPATEVLFPIHDRMPTILHPTSAEKWMCSKNATVEEILEILNEIDTANIDAYPVSAQVNNPSIDSAECIFRA